MDEATKQAVRRAIAAGKKLACATGRPWWSAHPVLEALGFIGPCVFEGGTRIADAATGRTIWEKPLLPGAASAIFAIMKAESSIGQVMHSGMVERPPIETVTSVPAGLRYLYLLAITEAAAIRIASRVSAARIGAAHYTPSWDGNGLVDIHITHPEATKQHGIHAWQKLVGVTKAQTIGMGDSGNDIPIFESAGLKVAVANGTANLKALADHIAPPVDQHPLKHTIEKFLLAGA